MDEDQTRPKGNGHKDALHFSQPPRRVVSLVPYMTESLFDLGVADALVGVTDNYHRAELEGRSLVRVGGPKDFRVDAIVDLQPDLVLANWEDNTLDGVNALRETRLAVWVTMPKTVRTSVDILWTLANLFRSQSARLRVQTLEMTLDWAISAYEARRPFTYFCPVWFGRIPQGLPWWMTFNQDTYSNDLLQLFGGSNVFEGRERRQPLEADMGFQERTEGEPHDFERCYPRLGEAEIRSAAPELILLPSEPYGFGEVDILLIQEMFQDLPAVQNRRIHLVDGALITWQGTQLARSLRELPALLDSFLEV